MSKLMLFIPMYNCAPQIGRVIASISPRIQTYLSEIILVDNGSRDHTVEAASAALTTITEVPWTILRNDRNYGLGGSHKVAFSRMIEKNHAGCIVLHGDDQALVDDLLPVLSNPRYDRADCLLGSRFMRGSRLTNYSPARLAGNLLFNALFSLVAGKSLKDLGSGLNLYRRGFVERVPVYNCPDDLTFNYRLILLTAATESDFRFFPISWREKDQLSNVRVLSQIKSMLRLLIEHCLSGRKTFIGRTKSTRSPTEYTSTPIVDHIPNSPMAGGTR